MRKLEPFRLIPYMREELSIAPLITFRVVFGAVMLYSSLRFWWKGWIQAHFLDTNIAFTYFGFEWVTHPGAFGIYALHAGMVLGALSVFTGAWYRWGIWLFFFTFTYTWLIDLTYYLNHYYFVSIIAFLLALVPANSRFSIDAWLNPSLQLISIPRWMKLIFIWQISIVYIYAGFAKINADWLLNALPLKIWLPAHDKTPLLGCFFAHPFAPWVFSWVGMLYDCTIVFWLSWAKTRIPAYVSVILFHALTGLLFQIGVFPVVMIGATWIFFGERFHEKLLNKAEAMVGRSTRLEKPFFASKTRNSIIVFLLVLHFTIQLLFPWRYLLYPGDVFWTEEGYRFSWRVMLMEKAGTATFYVKDGKTGREGVVVNDDFLSLHQEKQMAMQPDMILQYAHFLRSHYAEQGVYKPQVRAEVYVTLNGRKSDLLFDPQLRLDTLQDGWGSKQWLYPKPKK